MDLAHALIVINPMGLHKPVRILFVCLQGKIRSRTAAEVVNLEYPGYEARYGGTDKDALNPVTFIDLYWADIVVCVKMDVQRALQKRFPSMRNNRKYKGPSIPIRRWDIFDIFEYNQDILVNLIRQWMNGFHLVVERIDGLTKER
jgi:predicted protein tyrosine phosphatase